MVKFSNHINTQEITLKDASGQEETYTFKGLGAKHMPKLFKVLSSFSGVTEDTSQEELMKRMDEETMEALQLLVSEMVKKSYPNIGTDLEDFVGAHFMELFPVLFKVNLPTDK